MYNLFVESFALNWYVFVALTNKKLLLLFSVDLVQTLPDDAKLIGYFTSAVDVVASNPCVGSSPRIKISFP